MVSMRGFGAFLCLLAVTACGGSSPAAPTPFSREVVLTPGRTVAVSEGGVSLRFEGVTGDSRCPIDAICITGGDALVQLTVVPDSGAGRAYVLHTGDMRPVSHSDLTIALVDLTPYPYSARPIVPDDYRATVRVSR
jgi:hypothetical protein